MPANYFEAESCVACTIFFPKIVNLCGEITLCILLLTKSFGGDEILDHDKAHLVLIRSECDYF